MKLLELQRALQSHILAGASEVVPLLNAIDTKSALRRMAVYSHGYYARLIEVLGKDYLGLCALVGEQTFDTLARAYIATTPSSHFNARWVGCDLPAWLAAHEGYRTHTLWCEMATLDWAITLAFDAEDLLPVTFDAMRDIAPEQWPELRFSFHPALQLFDITTNVLEIKRALENSEELPSEIRYSTPQVAAVWRRDRRVFYRALPADEQCALQSARQGASFGELCEQLVPEAGDNAAQRAAEILRTWVGEHWLT